MPNPGLDDQRFQGESLRNVQGKGFTEGHQGETYRCNYHSYPVIDLNLGLLSLCCKKLVPVPPCATPGEHLKNDNITGLARSLHQQGSRQRASAKGVLLDLRHRKVWCKVFLKTRILITYVVRSGKFRTYFGWLGHPQIGCGWPIKNTQRSLRSPLQTQRQKPV